MAQWVVLSAGLLLTLYVLGVACGSDDSPPTQTSEGQDRASQSLTSGTPAVDAETEVADQPLAGSAGAGQASGEAANDEDSADDSDSFAASEYGGDDIGYDEIPVPPDLDLHEAATRLRTGLDNPPPRVLATPTGPRKIGESDTFFVYDAFNDENYTVTAVLEHVSDNAYWYVHPDLALPVDDLMEAAEVFEDRVRHEITSALGDIRSPGVDGDPRLTVLNTELNRVGGLFSYADAHTVQVHPYSNQREMVYISADKFLDFGPEPYLRVLAHEFMHAVQANYDNSDEAWFDEGLAEFAVDVSGYPTFGDRHSSFLSNPGVQLNYMDYESRSTLAHYEGAHRFFVYLSTHFGGVEAIGELLREQADGELGVDSFLRKRGTDFTQVFKDWVVANYVNAPEGRYGYAGLESGRARTRDFSGEGEQSREASQFSARYIDIRPFVDDFTVEFAGATETTIFDDSCYSGRWCWWSNKGDAIDTTLTREFDLTGTSRASLEYMAWYDIEEGWDYAYLQVSDDGGRTWRILHPEHASDADKLGNAYGPGYTGDSRGWVAETVDLSEYAGSEILVRFEYITDGAIHSDGLVIDDISLPEIGFFDDAEEGRGWIAAGFARIQNRLPQRFAVQVIADRGDENFEVFDLELDSENRGRTSIEGLGTEFERIVLAVSPVTLGTHQPTSYTVKVAGASE